MFDDLALLTLCDGYGGTELALKSLGRIRTVARVERDAYAAAVLVARMEDARLDPAPIWDSLETFDGREWRGRVDIIAAGFPCQPFSLAGTGGGVDDDRWLWPEIARIVRDVGPRFVLLENVPQLVRHGLPHILADLAALGFDAEWGLLTAAAIGAPHKRERFWLVAHNNRHGLTSERPTVGRATRPDIDRRRGGGLADPDGDRSRGERVSIGHEVERTETRRRGETVGNATSERRHEGQRPNPNEPTSRRADPNEPSDNMGTRPIIAGHRFPPARNDAAAWTEWHGPQPAIRRDPNGTTQGLADALHLGGNGLVPQCAAEAWRQLAERLTT